MQTFANERMKLLCLALVGAVLVAASGGCASKPTAKAPPALTPAATPSLDIASELQRSAAGWNAGNLDVFMEIYAEDATFATADNFVRGKAAIRALYAPAFAPGTRRDSLAMERIEALPISSNFVLVRGIYTNLRQGQVSRRGATSLLLRLTDGHWRIVHDHSN